MDWGSSNEQLLRHAAVAYGDVLSSLSGADRPNERLISNQIFTNPVGGITNARDMSGFVYAGGQFFDHDLTFSDSAMPAEFFSIAIPSGDPWFDPTGTGTASMPNLRTAYDPATGIGSPLKRPC